jgi:hypothetical protein
MGALISKFLGHVVPQVIKPLHSLWNQVIGFLFLAFTVLAISYVVRGVRDFSGDVEGLLHIVLPALFGVVMGYFGLSSFWRARKISRS